QRPIPLELVVVMGVVEFAAVGHIERVDAHTVAGRRQCAGLDDGILRAEGGNVRETDLGLCQPDAGGDGHAVPLVEPMEAHLITAVGEQLLGNCASLHLSSWMARTSTSERSSQAPMGSWLARIEFTFHVASLTVPPFAVGPRVESSARIAPEPLRARLSCVRPDP